MLCFFVCSFKLCNKTDIELTFLISFLFQRTQLTYKLALHQVILGLLVILSHLQHRLFFLTSDVGSYTSDKAKPLQCSYIHYLSLNIFIFQFTYGELDRVNNYTYPFNTLTVL